MEIIGVIILLTIFGVVVYYLDVFDDIMFFLSDIKRIVVGFFTDMQERKQIKKQTEILELEAARAKSFKEASERTVRLKSAIQGRKVKDNSKANEGTYQSFRISPEIQRQLTGMDRLFKGETLRALKYGRTPPHAVGKGRYNMSHLKVSGTLSGRLLLMI